MRLNILNRLAMVSLGLCAVPLQVVASSYDDQARAFLLSEASIHACDDEHLLYGVAYIDGSYMERVFYVEHPAKAPEIIINFRDGNWPATGRSGAVPDLPSRQFTFEIVVPRARYAVPVANGWRMTERSWGSAFRFKYTNWYGEIAHHEGQWQVDWKDYRRPLLPTAILDKPTVACDWFADPGSHDILLIQPTELEVGKR